MAYLPRKISCLSGLPKNGNGVALMAINYPFRKGVRDENSSRISNLARMSRQTAKASRHCPRHSKAPALVQELFLCMYEKHHQRKGADQPDPPAPHLRQCFATTYRSGEANNLFDLEENRSGAFTTNRKGRHIGRPGRQGVHAPVVSFIRFSMIQIYHV